MSRPDLRTVAGWFAAPEVLQLAFGTDATGEALELMGQEYLKEMDASRQVMLTVETQAARMVGFVRYSLFSPERGRTARVGIVIGERELWNQGYGTEAMQMFLSYLFQKKSVQWIELDTAHFNARAQRCFSKCGFTITATDPLPPDPEADDWGTPKVWMELHRDLWQSIEPGLRLELTPVGK
jgi:RimJ/RimL family protein N-acetyltransferase